ncbi:hypothetical protein C0J45_9835 [Silurus meridionalis]|nr:hypothetical protein C0J45_9835 [Silurus meridionalis]
MGVTNLDFIPDRSRPGLPTTVTGIIGQQGKREIGPEEEDVYRDSRKRRSGGKWRFGRTSGKGVRPGTLDEFKLFYHGVDGKGNGVGGILKEEYSEGNRGDEEVMGRYDFKERNVEGQMVVDFAKRMEMAVVNTYFKEKEDHRVTYKSGGRCTQMDYVLCRRCNLKEIGDCKMLAGDSVARQHRMSEA